MIDRIEVNTITDLHAEALAESKRIANSGVLASAVVATRSAMLGLTPYEEGPKLQDKFIASYTNLPRNSKVQVLQQIEASCREDTFQDRYNRGSRESSIAFHMRRLALVERIVKNDIAVGDAAVTTTDFILGSLGFDLTNFTLVRNHA